MTTRFTPVHIPQVDKTHLCRSVGLLADTLDKNPQGNQAQTFHKLPKEIWQHSKEPWCKQDNAFLIREVL